jgi:hypothetical protein
MNHTTFTRLVKVVLTVFAVIGICDIFQSLVENAWQLGPMVMRFPIYFRTLMILGVWTLVAGSYGLFAWWFINHCLYSNAGDREEAQRHLEFQRRQSSTVRVPRKEGRPMANAPGAGVSCKGSESGYTEPRRGNVRDDIRTVQNCKLDSM